MPCYPTFIGLILPAGIRTQIRKEHQEVTARRLIFFTFIPVLILFSFLQTASAQEVVLYASQAPVKVGNWSAVADSTAAGGARLANPDSGASKLVTAAANPSSYAEFTFSAIAGIPYRIWVRGKAQANSPYNDSIFVQFSGSLNISGGAEFRIGTTSAAEINLEDCKDCGIQDWGWQDNGWGVGILGPAIFFQSTGTQTLRIQSREDGFSIDQIVLSPSTYLFLSPGLLKNDGLILPASSGPAPTPTPTPTPTPAPTTGESANNTRLPPNTQIVDSAGAVWTRTSSGAILRNGAGTSGTGSQILYCNRLVYVFGTDSQWYRWNNGWTAVGTVDPCGGSSVTLTESANNTRLPPATQIVDSTLAVWTRTSSGSILRNGGGTSGTGSQILYCSRTVYVLGSDSQWYRWGGGWTPIGFSDPCGASPTPTPNPTPTPTPTPTPAPPPPPSGGSLRVLSWNGSFGTGTDSVRNYDRTAQYVANMNPDIAGLCEIPSEMVSTFINSLNAKTGRSWFWYHIPKYQGTTEGNLIISKYSFSSTSGRYLSYQRSVAQATIVVGGRTINFFATHLDPDSSGARFQQVTELQAFASGFSESRIVVGDFNAGPDTSESVRMTSGYYDTWMRAMNAGTATAYPDNPVYMHTRTRRGRIDYVFYSTSSSLVLQGMQVPDTRNLSQTNVSVVLGTLDDKGVRPSDHNPTIATFSIQ
jgi:endonuclease/exonuclease/phosphatase family metal-dependent hydrolase